MKAIVTVLPKSTVLDPQGAAIAHALQHLGLEGVRNVRMGKVIEIDLPSSAPADQLHQLCQDLLSNPVMEDYTLQIIK